MTAVGAVFPPSLPPERLRAVATAADEAGLDQLWLWEDCFREGGVASAAAALAWTRQLKVGVGILPVPLRNVAITAMELATLHRTFPGRPLMGVGHGVQSWMQQVGARVGSPLTLLGEHLDALRALLAGEQVSVEGRYVRLDGVRLDWPPDVPAPVLAAGEGPKTLRLTGAKADGTVLTGGTTPAEVARARELVDAGRVDAGRSGPGPITVYVVAASGPDAPARVEADLRQWFGDDAGSAADRAVTGDAAGLAAGLRPWLDAGADTVVLQPTGDEPDHEGFVVLAAEVGALLAG